MYWQVDVAEDLCERVMEFFIEAGHTSISVPLFSSYGRINEFIYLHINSERVTTNEDLLLLNSVVYASHLFSQIGEFFDIRTTAPQIDYFLLCLDINDRDRSQIAFDIHKIIAHLINTNWSIILFAANGKLMLSCGCREYDNSISIILSDWYSEDELLWLPGSTDRFNAGCFSPKPFEFFLDFADACARDYFIHTISYEYAAFEILTDIPNDSGSEFIGREIIRDNAESNMDAARLKYLDDYVINETDNSRKAMWHSHQDFILDLLELEMDTQDEDVDFTADILDDPDFGDEEESDDSEENSLFTELSDDVIRNPIEMLRIITNMRKTLDELNERFEDKGILKQADIALKIKQYKLPSSLARYIIRQLSDSRVSVISNE